jgi:hypothetical protein
VFVDIVKTFDGSQVAALVPSRVRLYRLNDAVDFGPRAFYRSHSRLSEEAGMGALIENGESGAVIMGTELPRQMIQRSPQVVDGIAEDAAPPFHVPHTAFCEAVDVLASAVPYFYSEEARVRPHDLGRRTGDFVELREVDLRSLDFDVDLVRKGLLPLPSSTHGGYLAVMSEDPDAQQTPTGHRIPVPTREDVFRDLRKVAKAPDPDSSDADGESGAEQE